MTQNILEGKNVLVEAVRGSSYEEFICATNMELSVDTDIIQRRGPGLFGFKSFVAGETEWSMTLNTCSVAAPSGSEYTDFDSIIASIRKNGLDIRVTYEDNVGNLKILTGHVLIPRTGITSPVDGFVEGSIEFKGDGPFAITTALINPVTVPTEVFSIFYTATGGETSYTNAILIGNETLLITRDGFDKEIILAGTPNSKQVKFDGTTGTAYFDGVLNAGEIVHIQYK